MSQVIALRAVEALRDDAFEGTHGYCMRFVRQVLEAVGGRTQAVIDEYRRGSARETMNAFDRTIFDVWNHIGIPGNYPKPGDMQEGDLLFKGLATSGINGHVGIAVSGHRVGLPLNMFVVIENSSFHDNPNSYGTVSGAKGFRTMDLFGSCELIARVTETA